MSIARHVHYCGQVQGVGFRYSARNLAGGFAVSGYVRNLPSGQVEVWVEGEPTEVTDFLAALTRQMAGYIQEQTEEQGTPRGMNGFSIRY